MAGSATTDQMPEQFTIAMITRNTIGVFDYNPVWFGPYPTGDVPHRATDAQELAQCVGYQAGITNFTDIPADYLAQPDAVLDVLRTVPAAWDKTRFLQTIPASDVAVARRKGRTWYIAGVNGKTLTIAPTASVTSSSYFPPTGEPISFTIDLAELGIPGQTNVQLFPDTSAPDPTLAVTSLQTRKFTVDTAPFGGFLASQVADRVRSQRQSLPASRTEPGAGRLSEPSEGVRR